MSVSQLAKEEGISTATLYYWRQQLRESGAAVPNSHTSSEQWSAQIKLAIVAETYSMTENELSNYCREKGLTPNKSKLGAASACTVLCRIKSVKRTLKNKLKPTKMKSKH